MNEVGQSGRHLTNSRSHWVVGVTDAAEGAFVAQTDALEGLWLGPFPRSVTKNLGALVEHHLVAAPNQQAYPSAVATVIRIRIARQHHIHQPSAWHILACRFKAAGGHPAAVTLAPRQGRRLDGLHNAGRTHKEARLYKSRQPGLAPPLPQAVAEDATAHASGRNGPYGPSAQRRPPIARTSNRLAALSRSTVLASNLRPAWIHVSHATHMASTAVRPKDALLAAGRVPREASAPAAALLPRRAG